MPVAQEKSPAPSVIALREQQSSNHSINGTSGAAGDLDEQANDQSTPLKEVPGHAGGTAASQSVVQGAKKSNQKLTRAANLVAQSSSSVQKPAGTVSNIGVGGSGTLGKQVQNLSSLTPQKQFMGKRGDRSGAGGGTAQLFENQGKQQLLPALNQSQPSSQAMSSSQQQASSAAPMRGKGQHGQATGPGQGTAAAAIQGGSGGVSQAQGATIKKDKLLITGDDILIEYVARLMIAVKSIKENMLKA